ncbi:unnamed protein product [Miscanthus lutarioriparius]|uniref:Uncharacterized protein n=1 Tax=Miscanthus lutarioriparius TaxID=422564 RepID=A0A811MSH3_9POAL|nr:unnamed protein product [Miscanthus lutarioriparius]
MLRPDPDDGTQQAGAEDGSGEASICLTGGGAGRTRRRYGSEAAAWCGRGALCERRRDAREGPRPRGDTDGDTAQEGGAGRDPGGWWRSRCTAATSTLVVPTAAPQPALDAKRFRRLVRNCSRAVALLAVHPNQEEVRVVRILHYHFASSSLFDDRYPSVFATGLCHC